MKTKLKLRNRSRRNNLLYLVLLYLPLLFCLGLFMHKGSMLASFVFCVICLLFDIVILSNLMYINQGCALRKISGSPSGSQAFYLSCPDLKVGRPNKKFRGALWAPKHASWGAQASQGSILYARESYSPDDHQTR